MQTKIKSVVAMLSTVVALGLCSCSTTSIDPYEKINRPIFKFNYELDKDLVRPVAKGYNKIIPTYIQARVLNFFNNLNMIPSTINDALQLNVYQTLADGSRFIANSTVGILGLYDVAAKMDLPPHHNDLGLTFARWGLVKSPYLVIPFFGPSTIRDAFGEVGNIYLSVWPYIGDDLITYPLFGVNKLNQRASLLGADKLVDTAFDPYVFVRDAYLQKRADQISKLHAGSAPKNSQPTDKDTYVSDSNTDQDTYVPANGNNDKDPYVPDTSSRPTDAKNNSVSTRNSA
jgi:phospholipid-binding lipoprotein MlaA